MTEFDWVADKDDVIVPSVDATAVYTNLDGDLVIRQQTRYGEDDQVIIIPKKYVPSLLEKIQTLIN